MGSELSSPTGAFWSYGVLKQDGWGKKCFYLVSKSFFLCFVLFFPLRSYRMLVQRNDERSGNNSHVGFFPVCFFFSFETFIYSPAPPSVREAVRILRNTAEVRLFACPRGLVIVMASFQFRSVRRWSLARFESVQNSRN